MRASIPALVLGLSTSVSCAPFETFQTGGFSNFDPNTGSFSVGTNTNLYQETSSSNADDFLLSFEKLFPGDGSFSDGAAFNPFASADGSCDEFCQKVLAIDTQSQAQFEQDFLAFQSQFGNSLSSGEETPSPGPSQPPTVQTQVVSSNNNNNNNNNNVNSKPDENFKSNDNVSNKNFLFFGNNNKNAPRNPPIQQQTVTNPPPTRSTTPFTVFTTTRRTTRPPRPRPTPTEEVKNSDVTARAPVTLSVAETTPRPGESSTKKTTKIKWTYNGKTIGTSTITEKPPGGGDKLPVAPFFNSVEGEEGGRQQRGMEDGARRSEADFPVFDAVPS